MKAKHKSLLNTNNHRVNRYERSLLLSMTGDIIHCKICDSTQINVVDSRIIAGVRRRRRQCMSCGNKTTTYEISSEEFDKILDERNLDMNSQEHQLYVSLLKHQDAYQGYLLNKDQAKTVMQMYDRLTILEKESDKLCMWEYDEVNECWQTSCGTSFRLHDDDKECTHFCPSCGKKIEITSLKEGE